MTALILGSVVFQDFEIPESIPLGGGQAGHLHKLPGGVRVFDAMGPDDDAISWSGRFRGGSALDRALQLDGMRRAGALVPLSILSLSYSVVIDKFIYTIRRPFEIDYTITLHVIIDNTQGIDSSIIASLDSLVGQDIAQGLALLGSVSASVSLALSVFTLAVNAISSLQESGGPQLQPAKVAAFALIEELNEQQTAEDILILNNPVGSTPIDTGPANLLATLAAIETEVALLSAGGYLSRAAANVISATG